MYACLAEISLEKGRVGMSTLEVIYEIMKQKWQLELDTKIKKLDDLNQQNLMMTMGGVSVKIFLLPLLNRGGYIYIYIYMYTYTQYRCVLHLYKIQINIREQANLDREDYFTLDMHLKHPRGDTE